MTDDIVARLRTWSADESTWDLLTEAADEIERLKNQISHIIEHNNPQIEQANNYFKLLEEELARCNKIIDDYEEEHSRLQAALRKIADGPLDADKSYASLLHELRSEARAALEGEATNDAAP